MGDDVTKFLDVTVMNPVILILLAAGSCSKYISCLA